MSRAVKKPSISSATTEARGSCGVAGGEYALYAGFGVVEGLRRWGWGDVCGASVLDFRAWWLPAPGRSTVGWRNGDVCPPGIKVDG